MWRFKHPTIRDAFASLVDEDTELMDIYLAGMPIDKLLMEVSCGNVGIQGVKVIVPSDRYTALIIRMETLDCMKSDDERILHRFLAYRCDREFLEQYIARYPHFIPSLKVGSYLYAVSDVDVITRLHEFELLPEQKRLDVVCDIRRLAVSTPDAGFLQKRVRDIFTEEEFTDILNHVRTALLPNLDGEIDNWRWNYNSEDDPNEYFSELTSALEDYRGVLADHPDAVAYIVAALKQIDQVIEDLQSELPQEPDYDDFYDKTPHDGGQDTARSIFDDVDL